MIVATSALVTSDVLCRKSGKSDLFSLRPLRISALSALKGPLTQRTQRYAEGRRGKTSISTRFFVQSPPDVLKHAVVPKTYPKSTNLD